jgi:hypothetical protein
MHKSDEFSASETPIYRHNKPSTSLPPPQPFAENTDMCCMLILKPFLFGGEFLTLQATPEKHSHC